MAEMKLSDLAAKLGGTLSGDGDKPVRGVAPIESAREDEVTFLANRRYEKHVATTRAAAVIVPADYAGPCPEEVGLIRCEDSYFAFREVMVAFHGFRRHPFEGVDPAAAIHPTAELGEGTCVAGMVTICRGVRIGANAVIYPGVFIGPDCRIGDDCTFYPNVTLYDGTIIHDRVAIHAGTSIGHDGFGYATHGGRHEKIPQAGWVEIEDDVEMGACCAIDRATMGPTVIGAGTKFSNLVAIGHGTKLGRHCLIVAQVGIAGSVNVGSYCVFGGQAGVAPHIQIGDGARIGGQAGVVSSVPAGQDVGGFPSMPLPLTLRVWATLRQLPTMRSEVLRLTKELNVLKQRLGIGGADRDHPAAEKEDEG